MDKKLLSFELMEHKHPEKKPIKMQTSSVRGSLNLSVLPPNVGSTDARRLPSIHHSSVGDFLLLRQALHVLAWGYAGY